ncbi:MAG: acyl-CoA synthetase, partial [Euryarchaeota archaeon]|nr:acyl-CoA synthetase [Euryarchaeota archaeon]
MTRDTEKPWYCTLNYDRYEDARREFSWDLPENYNLADDLLRKHPNPDAPALHQAYPDGRRETYSFEDLDRRSNRLANALEEMGVSRGDRVGVIVPQKPENLLAHLACWKLGAVSLPLSVLFGPDALGYRLRDSEARVVVADESVREVVEEIESECPDLTEAIVVDGEGETSFESVIDGHSEEYEITESDPETPAIIMYTSGSTGPP